MKKNLFIIATAALLLLASFALADDGLGVLPTATYAPDSGEARAVAVVLAERPAAVINYILQDFDDGRPEWNVFFTDGADLGEAEVNAETYELRKIKSYEKTADMLTADKAVAQLIAAKGALTITELELDRDDGTLWYEGDAELDGRRYEFEMRANGKIVEWERD